jgi:hypothetical protein
MSADDYRTFVAYERHAARLHLESLLQDWRRELWPDPYADPIGRENRRRRERALLATEAYWGLSTRRLMYGGICAS